MASSDEGALPIAAVSECVSADFARNAPAVPARAAAATVLLDAPAQDADVGCTAAAFAVDLAPCVCAHASESLAYVAYLHSCDVNITMVLLTA